MNEIPTAEELLSNNFDGLKEVINDDDLFYFYKGVVCEFAKEFAKLHVEAALKEASEQAGVSHKPKFPGDVNWTVDMDSILNSYPLENIK